MQKFFNNPQYSDLQIQFSDEVIYGHRIVLSRIGYFLTLFDSGMKEAKNRVVSFPDISPQLGKTLLKSAYDYSLLDIIACINESSENVTMVGTIHETTKNHLYQYLIDLLKLADRFLYSQLVSDIIGYLTNNNKFKEILNCNPRDRVLVLTLQNNHKINVKPYLSKVDLKYPIVSLLPIHVLYYLATKFDSEKLFTLIFTWIILHPDASENDIQSLIKAINVKRFPKEWVNNLYTYREVPLLRPLIIEILYNIDQLSISRLPATFLSLPSYEEMSQEIEHD